MRRIPFVGLLILGLAACDDTAKESETIEPIEITGDKQQALDAIRDVAVAEGLTNGALLAGIAISETRLVHCWKHATWACKGPNSPSCDGGPVIAGSGDGACSKQQGGLGMFQFDAGTYTQTLKRDGEDILTLEGNITKAVEFVADMIISDVKGIKTKAEALAWLNALPMDASDARMKTYAGIVACRYNGCCDKSQKCIARGTKYRDNALDVHKRLGADFWQDK